MKVLVINAGSSSLKYQLLDTESEEVLAKGNCERIGIDGSRLIHKTSGKDEYVHETALPNHSAAMKLLVETLVDPVVGCISSVDEIEAVGHRVVHGGQYFADSVLLSDEVLEAVEKCIVYAPLSLLDKADNLLKSSSSRVSLSITFSFFHLSRASMTFSSSSSSREQLNSITFLSEL